MERAMPPAETILALPRRSLPPEWVQPQVSLALPEADFFERLRTVPMVFAPRSALERDPTHKQIIPYLLVQTPDRAHTACYRRNGSEKRLHTLWSVGIGGHIARVDRQMADEALESIVRSGLAREISEEFRSLPPAPPPRFLGIVNEERSEVGSVHLGLVFRLEVAATDRVLPGEELEGFRWLETTAVSGLHLELWSRLALQLGDPAR
jgi:predicted NUDIX family phosphoesterase